jgi:hypothetical protein
MVERCVLPSFFCGLDTVEEGCYKASVFVCHGVIDFGGEIQSFCHKSMEGI